MKQLRTNLFRGASNIASGVCSNATFWSFANQILLTDDTYLPKRNFEWQELRESAEQNILTLGLPIVKGSIVWHGTNFTADVNRTLPVGEGPRQMVGFIACPDGLPSVIHADILNLRLHRDIYLDRATFKRGELEIPSKWDIVNTSASGRTHKWTFKLIDFTPTNFPSGSTAVQVIAGDPGEAPVTVMHKYPDGTTLILQEAGHKMTPKPVRPATDFY